MSVSVQAKGLFSFVHMEGGMKSTQDRAQRQQKCESQVNFFEKQKENLKNMDCTTLEDIARKLEMFHSYEDQIAAAKKQFNNSQMMHVLDEAKEVGEKIAEAAEKMAPKTEEELREERIEEAAGTEEESKGMLTEIMEEVTEVMEEMEEELEEMEEDLDEEPKDGLDQVLEEELNQEPGNELAGEEQTIPVEEAQQTVDAKAVQELGEGGEIQNHAEVQDETLAEAIQDHVIQSITERKAETKEQEEKQRGPFFGTDDWKKYRHIDYRL